MQWRDERVEECSQTVRLAGGIHVVGGDDAGTDDGQQLVGVRHEFHEAHRLADRDHVISRHLEFHRAFAEESLRILWAFWETHIQISFILLVDLSGQAA